MGTNRKGWFEVFMEVLAKLLERRGKAFAIFELIQNSWDTDAERVVVELEPEPGAPFVTVRVTDDDPHGFARLEHAFTLFAESSKKGDPMKRGRFNLGEKLVLALCRSASVSSMSGTVYFVEGGMRRRGTYRTKVGTIFEASMRMTRAELDEVLVATKMLIPPVSTTVNRSVLLHRGFIERFPCVLPTEVADEEGYLRRVERKTELRLYEVREGEKATLYEMGIPVVELPGDRWHVNVAQKVPLALDRDNVSPSYLRQVRVTVLNATTALLRSEDARQGWVREAASDARASKDAIEAVTTLRFGTRRVIDDSSDPEGTRMAVSQGYTVIHGGSLSAGEWENVKRHGAALPAGQVTPSPKPFSPDGKLLDIVERADETAEMRAFRNLAWIVGNDAVGLGSIIVRFTEDASWRFNAAYSRLDDMQGIMTVSAAPKSDFVTAGGNVAKWLRLIIHELGHHFGHHLEAAYHEALCEIGSKLPALAAENPEVFGLSKPLASSLAAMFDNEIKRGAAPAIKTGAVVAALIEEERRGR